ncbi:MAG TPA: NAD(P)/FAD-dependent oxidoreductase [Pseudonocardia sp.]|nr:NAD(P)/FAD-dependent oxidoreductase [Pseudonocardia sp.]
MSSGREDRTGRPDVAVIGSGPAGMAAAFRLQQAGARVRVLEANDYVGGRTRTEYRDGFVINQGATVIWSGYRSMLGIINDAGLGDELVPAASGLGFVRAPDDISVLDTEHLLRDAYAFPLSNRSRLTVFKLLYDALRSVRKLTYENLHEAAYLDVESAEQYGRRRLNDELLDVLIRPAAKSLAAAPASEISIVDLLFSLSRFMGIGAEWLALRGGTGSYAAMLSKGFDVTLGARVSAVEETGDEVAVSWCRDGGGERTERFAGCVLAVPAPAAAELHHRLDPERKRFLAQSRYASMTTVNLALSKPPKGIRAALFAHPETAAIFTSVFEHNKYPGLVPEGKGLVGVYPSDEFARELEHQDDDTVIERVVAASEKILPRMTDDIEFASVRHWNPGAFHGRVGHYRDLAKFVAADDRLIQFAGDYFAPTSMNTASTSGERAARNLVRALGLSA